MVIIGSSSCNSYTSPNDVSDLRGNSFLDFVEINETHRVGESNCPQLLDKVKVYCGKGVGSCIVDSVSIENLNPSLYVEFENKKSFTLLKNSDDPKESNTLKVYYNCNATTSFEYMLLLVFYKNGIKTDQQGLTVNLKLE